MGTTSSNAQGFYQFNGPLYFEASNGANGAELWKSDGTTSGTTQVKDIRAGSAGGFDNEFFTPFIEWNGSFYFRAETNGLYDGEIWKSNGTTAGTVLVQDIYSGTTSSNTWGFTILNNTYLLFVATNLAYGEEVWAFNMPGLTLESSAVPAIEAEVYPNPSDGRFTLALRQDVTNGLRLDFIDIQGRLVKQMEFEPGTGRKLDLDLSHVGKGIYLMRLTDGEAVSMKRIIVN
jgi:ELWxxDGT repeat protein